jgi:AmmeMemoRadiSam system protein B
LTHRVQQEIWDTLSLRKEVIEMKIRKPDFSGSWYPGREKECTEEIETFLEHPAQVQSNNIKGIAGIVPHAGWTFSGRIACNVINCLQKGERPDVVLIFGSHLGPGSPHQIMKEGAWETPLGQLEIEESLADRISRVFRFDVETPSSHGRDNTIELQLPFIKYFFPDTKIIPFGVAPDHHCLQIGTKAVQLANEMGLKSKVIGSTDLTHYGPNYFFTPKGRGGGSLKWVREENDRKAIDFMIRMDPERLIEDALQSQNACCPGGAAAAIAAAKELGSEEGECIFYATSYDVHPDDSFVGYAGIVY